MICSKIWSIGGGLLASFSWWYAVTMAVPAVINNLYCYLPWSPQSCWGCYHHYPPLHLGTNIITLSLIEMFSSLQCPAVSPGILHFIHQHSTCIISAFLGLNEIWHGPEDHLEPLLCFFTELKVIFSDTPTHSGLQVKRLKWNLPYVWRWDDDQAGSIRPRALHNRNSSTSPAK